MTTPWKFIDAARQIVARIDDVGRIESCLVTRADVQDWIQTGNSVLPPDPPPPLTQDQVDATAANAYPKLVALRGMSPAQVDAWVTANVTNLGQAQDAIKTLAIAVAILARRL